MRKNKFTIKQHNLRLICILRSAPAPVDLLLLFLERRQSVLFHICYPQVIALLISSQHYVPVVTNELLR